MKKGKTRIKKLGICGSTGSTCKFASTRVVPVQTPLTAFDFHYGIACMLGDDKGRLKHTLYHWQDRTIYGVCNFQSCPEKCPDYQPATIIYRILGETYSILADMLYALVLSHLTAKSTKRLDITGE